MEKLFAFLAILSTLIYGLQSAPVNNLGVWDSPCLALDSEGPVDSRGISDMIDDLLARTEDVRILSQQLKQYNKEVFNYPGVVIGFLDINNFIDSDRYTATENVLSEATANPVSAVQSHYALMYELVVHVNKSRTDGRIKKMTRSEYPARNETLRDKLHHIQEKMYDIICSMKIALRGEGGTTEHNITQDVLKAKFLSFNQSLTNESFRAYMLMNDSEGIMDYLQTVYRKIANTQTSQNS